MRLFPAGYGRTPHRALVVAVALAWWLAQPPLVAAYYDAQLRRGAYRPEADSIGIPIFTAWGAWGAVTPLVLAALAWTACRGAAGLSYAAVDWGRRARTLGWTAVAALGAYVVLEAAVLDALDGHPWLALAQVPGVLAFAWLRSAVVAAPSRAGARPAAT
jgi:hypothetical protein